MHTLTFIDLEARVLDEPEKEKAIKLIIAEADKRTEQMRSITLHTNKGDIVDGAEIFVIAQGIDDTLNSYSPKPFEFEGVLTTVDVMNQLAQLDPAFYDYPFLNGKNLLAAVEIKEIEVINNRENLSTDNNLIYLKKRILGCYDEIENYLKKATELFDKFTDSLDEEGKELMKTYRTRIKSSLAQMYRRKAFFTLRSTPTPEEATQLENLAEILKLTRISVDLHREIFQNEIFLDDYEAAGTLANLANALKMYGAQDGMKGLKYYEEAKKICGPHPFIEEGIAVYKILSSSDDNSYMGLLH